MINEYKIKDNLYLLDENIFLFSPIIETNYDLKNYQPSELIRFGESEIPKKILYDRSRLIKNIVDDYGVNNIDDFDLSKLNIAIQYIEYYIYYIKYNKLHKKYLLEIYKIAEYLQDIALENIANTISYECNKKILNGNNLDFVYDCLYLLYNGENDYVFLILLNNVLIHRPGKEIKNKIKNEKLIQYIESYNLSKPMNIIIDAYNELNTDNNIINYENNKHYTSLKSYTYTYVYDFNPHPFRERENEYY